ncbi:MAG TPA: metalloregulator ArsR/SmtB family transcription factor [Rhizomicrobium sp.]|nr:metalloregulator ArsR/SmtB family transcription factor [Rhizomicrobium sp.]
MERLAPKELRAMRRNAAEAAEMLRILSHEARLGVLCELALGERSAGELVRSSGLTQSALSQHLAKLREQGLVRTRREGQAIYYALHDGRAARIIGVLHEIYCARNGK